MSKITADEYFKENAVWNSTILMNPTRLMEGFAEIKCKEQREICQKELCNIFGHTAQNYEQTINDGTINAPSPKINPKEC